METSIVNLPFYVVGKICRCLSHGSKDHFEADCDVLSIYTAHAFARSLKSLRATCSYMRTAVDQTSLKFRLDFDYIQEKATELENIASYSEWKVSVLYLTLNQHRPNSPAESCVIDVFDQNEKLIQKLFQLQQIFIEWDPNQYTLAYLRKVIDRFATVKAGFKIHLNVVGWLLKDIPDIGSVSLPEVENLKINFCQWAQAESLPDSLVKTFTITMPNVTEFRVHHYKLNNIQILSKWKILERFFVSSLDIPNTQVLLDNICHLSVDYLADPQASFNLINKTFLNLNAIDLRAVQPYLEESTETLSLPCHTVGINCANLRIVNKNKSVKQMFVQRFTFNQLPNLLEMTAQLNSLMIEGTSALRYIRAMVSSILSRFASLEFLTLLLSEPLEYCFEGEMENVSELGTITNFICEKMTAHNINLLVLQSVFRGRIVFAKWGLSVSQIENYSNFCSRFEWHPISRAPFPLTLDDMQCINGIYISAADIGDLKHAIFPRQ